MPWMSIGASTRTFMPNVQCSLFMYARTRVRVLCLCLCLRVCVCVLWRRREWVQQHIMHEYMATNQMNEMEWKRKMESLSMAWVLSRCCCKVPETFLFVAVRVHAIYVKWYMRDAKSDSRRLLHTRRAKHQSRRPHCLWTYIYIHIVHIFEEMLFMLYNEMVFLVLDCATKPSHMLCNQTRWTTMLYYSLHSCACMLHALCAHIKLNQ